MNQKNTEILVALAGQPNSGKSTIFNLLTGARQHVANYPGITVEKKIGSFTSNGDKVVIVDLPGTYSMTSYTQEERIARDFLLFEKPEVVVDVVDASNLERNLYLAF
ncbi:MAG: 50S ribosome-binding GTPase, partial [Candidatus Omnitrophica bacterium]|nr:50S ribosome-binding GTPase [Candidatus Omnitrophota bacterium]